MDLNLTDIPVEVSARHVHLSQKVADALFGKNYNFSKRKDLSQPGQFACEERVDIKTDKDTLKNVAILGPLRKKTQVEISLTDARKIGAKCLIRESGDLDGTPGCTLIGPKGSFEITEGLIIAKRHIHMAPKDAEKLSVKNGEEVKVRIKSKDRSLIFENVVARVSEKFSLAMHIDTDEGNAVQYDSEMAGNLFSK
ncbi:MAG: phosphate propanoyltransferase [Clostridia bacterium]|nr:phosphate propanoyltransferase [Clostridia bacterium]